MDEIKKLWVELIDQLDIGEFIKSTDENGIFNIEFDTIIKEIENVDINTLSDKDVIKLAKLFDELKSIQKEKKVLAERLSKIINDAGEQA